MDKLMVADEKDVEIFDNFLKRHGAYRKFWRNVRSVWSSRRAYLMCPINAISITGAFSFERMPEAEGYWWSLSKKWEKEYEEKIGGKNE